MVKSNVSTVEQYLAELPEGRSAVVSAVVAVIRKNLPRGYREGINWGMIAYEVPLQRYPTTYNKQPLNYAAVAAQKNHFAVYVTCVDDGSTRKEQLRAEFEKAGKKLDMGKSCIRFKKLDDIDLGAIGRLIAQTPVDKFIARYEASRTKT